MTHSLYIHDPNGYGVEVLYDLPREIWEGDIDAALNWVKTAADGRRRGAGRPHAGSADLPSRRSRDDVSECGAPPGTS